MASALVNSAADMILGMLRYDSLLGGGPIQTASSAKRTCRLSRSAVEYTATLLIPISRHVRIIRNAISPRLAINIFLNMNVLARRNRRYVVISVQPKTTVGRILQAVHRLPVS